MSEEEELYTGETAGSQKTKSLILVFVCAGISAFFLNTGLLSFLYLVPLGYAVMVSGSAWFASFAAAAVNAVFCIFTRLISHNDSGGQWGVLINIFYFTTMFLCFAWIMGGGKFANIRTAYRFVLASAAGSVALLIFFLTSLSDSNFNAMIGNMAEVVSSMIISSAGDDAVRQMLTPEKLIGAAKNIILRGGALSSIFFLFFINRQISLAAVWIIKKQRKGRGLTAFFAPSYTIWVLSGSLAVILVTRLFRLGIFEIMAWNVFTVCVILFLAQGAGILMYMLARRPPGFRLAANIVIIMVIISPINTFALAALLLLGIAENWLPFRVPKQGEASTPGL